MYKSGFCSIMIVISCVCVDTNVVTSNSIPLGKDEVQTMINELKIAMQEEISALNRELHEAKSQLADTRLYLGQSIIALSNGAKVDSKHDEEDTERSHVIERRSAPESDGSHDDVLSSLSLHDLMPLLSSRCRDGKDGKDGINGINGKDGIGRDGKDGRDGINGKDGVNGKDGRDGLPGPRGDDGLPGNPGTPGAQGPTGSPGLRGIPGRPGNATKGEKGIQGEPGAKGSQGLQGVAGVAGTPGAAGTPGPQGAHGSAGLPGVRGPSGVPGSPGNTSESGSVYTRWGRTTCDGDTAVLYHGFAAAAFYHTGSTGGGGVNYQCLHPQPEYNNYNNGGYASIISGAEYQSESLGLFPNAAHDQNVPCARCYTSRSAVVMIPSRRSCNSGWTKEYEGYLMANYVGHNQPTTYECVDGQPEYIAGHSANTNGALFYFVKPDCSGEGTIGHCPPYDANKQLTCVVCSK